MERNSIDTSVNSLEGTDLIRYFVPDSNNSSINADVISTLCEYVRPLYVVDNTISFNN